MGLMGTIIARYSESMRASPFTDLRRGTEFLWQRPLWSLALAGLGTLLSALAPLLQIRSKLPDIPVVILGLTFAATLPLDLYFIPRFLLAVDAETLDHPRNPRLDWRVLFESRWLRAFGTRLLLYLIVFAGATCFILPGLVALVLFGWAPWRVLLRGESIQEAMKGSAAVMTRRWPPVVYSVTLLTTLCFLVSALVTLGLTHGLPEPTPWQRLTHPAIWAANFVNLLLGLWLNAAFLSLYHRIESSESAKDPEGAS